MKSLLAVAAIFFAVALTDVAAAQAPPSQYEHLKVLEDHIGIWEGAMEWPETDVKVQMRITYTWVYNKSYIQGVMETGSGEGFARTGGFMYGWDGVANQLRCWAFQPDSQMSGPISQDGNTTHYALDGPSASGEATSGDVYHTIEGTRFLIDVKNRKRGTATLPDLRIVLHRAE